MASRSTPQTLDDFTAALGDAAAPEGLDKALQALWHEAQAGGPGGTQAKSGGGDMAGAWQTAHHLVQRQRDARGRWVHGYLHRLEGDDDNAAGWYERAGQPFPTVSFAEEWQQIVTALLAPNTPGA